MFPNILEDQWATQMNKCPYISPKYYLNIYHATLALLSDLGTQPQKGKIRSLLLRSIYSDAEMKK